MGSNAENKARKRRLACCESGTQPHHHFCQSAGVSARCAGRGAGQHQSEGLLFTAIQKGCTSVMLRSHRELGAPRALVSKRDLVPGNGAGNGGEICRFWCESSLNQEYKRRNTLTGEKHPDAEHICPFPRCLTSRLGPGSNKCHRSAHHPRSPLGGAS